MTDDTRNIEEPKDWTRAIWIGIGVLFTAMLLIIGLAGRAKPPVSMVNARHILIKFAKEDPADRERALEQISEIRRRIEGGADFGDMARQYSEDPGSARRGGRLSEAPRGTFEETFENHVWNAPVGALSEIIETSYGFHLIVVTGRHLTENDKYELELEERARDALERGEGQEE
jgi:parvulin-like peptidyl-prolyl isomerase